MVSSVRTKAPVPGIAGPSTTTDAPARTDAATNAATESRWVANTKQLVQVFLVAFVVIACVGFAALFAQACLSEHNPVLKKGYGELFLASVIIAATCVIAPLIRSAFNIKDDAG